MTAIHRFDIAVTWTGDKVIDPEEIIRIRVAELMAELSELGARSPSIHMTSKRIERT